MDVMGLAGMLFTLILAAMVGGFILLFPVARRLGAVLEGRLKERASPPGSIAEVRRLDDVVRGLQQEVERLAERQAFTEALLSERDPLLPPGDSRVPRPAHPGRGTG